MFQQKIYVILDNIRSRENIGSIFRTADAARVDKIYLCGITPTPPHQKISKTALGAENWIPWEYHKQTWRLLKELKANNIYIAAIEQLPKAINYKKFKPKFPLALVLGNEVKGLSDRILRYADKIVAIPMYGKKESLNVAVAAGIVIYQLINF